MNVLDLFTGIGGFSLGLERAGMRTVAFCEIDPFCRSILRKHWPNVPIYDDVTTLTAARLATDGIVSTDERRSLANADFGYEHKEKQILTGREGPRLFRGIDVISGGFPCQDISVAGKGAGIEGSRSGLWSEYARIIGEVRPRYVIVENVAALLGRGLERVLGDLAALRYDAEWHCIRASAVGAPHRRDRVWIVAHPQGVGCDGKWEGGPRLRFEIGGRSSGPNSDWWRTEPNVGRVAHGVSFELDLVREIENGNCNYQETEPEAQVVVRRLLRAMWESASIAETSSDLYRKRLYHLVPELPQGNPHSLWNLGPWIKEDKELCRMWESLYSAPLHEAQDLQQRVLERIGEKKRPQALGSRVERLRSLGNAVVPQIPEIIGRAIMEHNRTIAVPEPNQTQQNQVHIVGAGLAGSDTAPS